MQIELQKDQNLNEIVSKLKNHFQPLKIYLFGSRAKGTATTESDYDLFLIVKSSDKTKLKRVQEAYQILLDRTVGVDIFIYTEAEFNDWKDEFSSIPYTVAHEGVEIDLGAS